MKEKLNGERCIAQVTGSCDLCPIQDIAQGKIMSSSRGHESKIIHRIQKTYCPTGVNMDIPKRPEPPIWQV